MALDHVVREPSRDTLRLKIEQLFHGHDAVSGFEEETVDQPSSWSETQHDLIRVTSTIGVFLRMLIWGCLYGVKRA